MVAGADGSVQLVVGTNEWRLPIPIVKHGDLWHSNVQTGTEEIRTRRIANNELSAMHSALVCCEAQMEYAPADGNDEGGLEYARWLVSSPGMRYGLLGDERSMSLRTVR